MPTNRSRREILQGQEQGKTRTEGKNELTERDKIVLRSGEKEWAKLFKEQEEGERKSLT